jgi:hypothetical protein
MTRSVWAALALLVTTAASPAPSLPVPPIPPDNPPLDQTAPVPNPDIRAPLDTSQSGVRVNVQDFRVNRYDQSPGYTPGSQFETSEDKRPIQTPGLTLQVPLH